MGLAWRVLTNPISHLPLASRSLFVGIVGFLLRQDFNSVADSHSLRLTTPPMDLVHLIEELECPVCYQTPRSPPVFQCENGHLICAACKPRMSKCPQGGCLLEDSRSRLAEHLLDRVDIPRPCVYSVVGCFHEDLLPDLVRHENGCEYRKVHCPDVECGDEILAKNVIAHLKEEHPPIIGGDHEIEAKEADRCVWIIDPDDLRSHSFSVTWPISIWKSKDQLFFSVLHKVRNSTLWYAWIYSNCTPDAADKMMATLCIKSKSGVPNLTFRGRVHPLDISSVDIIKRATDCLITTDGLVNSFLTNIPDKHKKGLGEQEQEKYLLPMEYSVTIS